MENLEDILPEVLIGFVVWLVIMYLIIKGAVSSATHSQNYFLKTLFRMKAKQMVRQGHSYEEIKSLFEKSEDEFWKELHDESMKKD